jgi:hypothetical protein
MTRTGRVLVALLLAIYIGQCLHYIASTSLVEDDQRYFLLWDDAMISMQYARNLAAGNGLVWVAGEEPVQGFTNLGITLLMALLHLLPAPAFGAPLLFQLVNLACLVAIACYTYRLTDLLFERPGTAFAAAALTLLYGPLNVWSLQGSDAGVLALITLMALVELVPGRRAGQAPRARMYGMLAIGVVVRQDFSLVFALFLAFQFLVAPAGGRLKSVGFGVALLLGVWASLLLFSQWYYGDPLPNTYYLKATGNPRELVLRSGLSQLIGVFNGRAFVALALLGLYATFLARTPRRDVIALIVGLIALTHAYYVWVGGDWVIVHTSRYLVSVMPLLIALLCGGAGLVAHWLRERGVSPAVCTAMLLAQLATIGFSLNPASSIDEWHLRRTGPLYKAENRNNVRFGRSLCRYTSEDTTVGVFWAGVPPYVCDRTYVDLLGRADRHIAKLRVSEFRGPGHAKWDWDYILNERHIDVLSSLTSELQPRADFRAQYCIARLPRAGIAVPVRKEAEHKLLDRDRRLCEAFPYPPCRDCRL